MAVEAEPLQFELLDLILEDSAGSAALTDHAECVALSSCMRGKLCEQMTGLPARQLRPGERLYRIGNPARSLFLLRSGLIKTSALSPDGEPRGRGGPL